MLTIPKCQDYAVSFVDILRIYFRNPLSRKTRHLLRKNCAGIKKRVHENGAVTYSVQQPNMRAIGILDRHFRRNRDFINKVEIALDICTDSYYSALNAAIFFRRCAWHRFSRESAEAYRETYYTKRRKGRKENLAVYPTGYSKVLCAPALHIERRLKSARIARRAGISRPKSLLCMDICSFWRKRWHFLDFDDNDLLSAVKVLAERNNISVERIAKLIQIIITCDDEGTPSAANFRRFCLRTHLQPERYVHPVQVKFPRHFEWVFAENRS